MELIPHLNLRTLDDFSLVQQAVGGNQNAYTALYERYQAPLFHFIYQRTRNSEDARDLTLEAFGKAFRKLESYVPRHSFSTWLFRIAMNNYIDFARRTRLARSLETELDLSFLAQRDDGRLNPEDAMIRQERIALVFTLLQQLSPRYRRMLELRFFEEMSYEEMAESLHIPIGTVKAQLFRAKDMMRDLLLKPKAQA